jgi:hypothetical protein
MASEFSANIERWPLERLIPHARNACTHSEEIEHIYFPHTGMISLLAVLKNGKAIETATVGREVSSGRWLVLDCTLPWHEPSYRGP